MPRDGSGVYSLPAGYLATTGNTILASQHNSPLEDIRDAITGSLPRNGAAAMTGNLAMGGNAITGAGAITADVFNFDQASDVASATTTDLGAALGNYLKITGTTTITGLGTATAGAWRMVTFTGALILTHNATSLILPGALNITTVAGDSAEFISEGSGNWRCIRYTRASGKATSRLPRAYLAGLTLANNGTDATNDIDIAAGEARDSTDATDMVLASALTKQLDSVWAVGTNQGGLDTGTKAVSTVYYVWLIKRVDTGVVDVLFSTSISAPTMPTNYTLKRRIGAIRTDAAGVISPFIQEGDQFTLKTLSSEVSVTNLSTTAVLYTLLAPAEMEALFIAFSDHASLRAFVLVTDPDTTDEVPTGSLCNASMAGAALGMPADLRIRTSSSRQIRARSSSSATTFRVNLRGWIDRRGRDD